MRILLYILTFLVAITYRFHNWLDVKRNDLWMTLAKKAARNINEASTLLRPGSYPVTLEDVKVSKKKRTITYKMKLQDKKRKKVK